MLLGRDFSQYTAKKQEQKKSIYIYRPEYLQKLGGCGDREVQDQVGHRMRSRPTKQFSLCVNAMSMLEKNNFSQTMSSLNASLVRKRPGNYCD